MKTYLELPINDRINIKQHAINVHGKMWHPYSFTMLIKLSQISIIYILSAYYIR